jgi:hypothetical protein
VFELKSKKMLEIIKSELDFIRIEVDFIILTLKMKLDYGPIELDPMKNMSCTAQLKRF